jgi:uncharacterized protein (TIGR03437 family)
VAPPAVANYIASVEALSGDGQTSQQALGLLPPPSPAPPPSVPVPFTSSNPANPSISVKQGQLLPGADSEVDIAGVHTTFVAGQVSVGFGDSDIVVRHVWVVSPTEVLLNVTVIPSAQVGPVELTATSGLQLETLSAVLQVQTNAVPMSLNVPVLNALTNLEGVQAGGGALINSTGLPQNLTGWTLTVGGQPASFIMGGGNQIYAQIPAGLPLGPAVVQLISPNGQIPPVVMEIIAPAPVVQGVVDSNGNPISSSNPALPGATLTVTVTGLAGSAAAAAPVASNVNISVAGTGGAGGVSQTASTLLPGTPSGVTQVQFTLNANAPYGPQEQLTVGLGLRISLPFPIAVAQSPAQSQ